LPSHSAQTSACHLSGLSFTGSLWPALPFHPAQTSYKRSSGYFFDLDFASTSTSMSSSPDELQVLVWLVFQLGLNLDLPFHVIQPRRASSTRLDFFFYLNASLLPPLPSQSAQTSDKHSSGISFYLILWTPSLSPSVQYPPALTCLTSYGILPFSPPAIVSSNVYFFYWSLNIYEYDVLFISYHSPPPPLLSSQSL
jgi:hypothetical protein